MRIGILGSGLMGGKLGTIFARAGHEVVFSYARIDSKLMQHASDAGNNAQSGTPQEAADGADVVLLAVHWSRLEDVLAKAGDLSGKVIVTCSLPMNDANTELIIANTRSGAEELVLKVPGAFVVSAFGTVPSEVLFGVFESRQSDRTRPSLLFCSDNNHAKKVAADLIRDAGFDPLDAGPLHIARYLEPFALAVAQIAYEGEGGPEIAYRFERFLTPSRHPREGSAP